MFEINSLKDISALQESIDVECKLARGQDGQGKLPIDFWETYSSFANGNGGDIILGVKQNKDNFSLQGIRNIQSIIDELFSTLNNQNKVSVNLLSNYDVRKVTLSAGDILHIHIPRAYRKQKPVYINGNPLKGTYKRLNTGDQLCREEEVRRMLAEQVEESRDEKLLLGFGVNDINKDTLQAYRNLFSSNRPGHPWLEKNETEFLKKLGAWHKDRLSGEEGLTVAGLLMFGNSESICEVFPNFFLDYQEIMKDSDRWADRLVPDGTWSGNIFDFYRKVYRKLVNELKVPFAVVDGFRKDDTLVHQALRESLVNTLVHADYAARCSLKVEKFPELFRFSNPGLMRIPIDLAIEGGESDCRNKNIQKMFIMVGLGERAGSGIPKIIQGWESQHWQKPKIYEREDVEQTVLELRPVDLFPKNVLVELGKRFGSSFKHLSEQERLILATLSLEKYANHKRLLHTCKLHSHDLTLTLKKLVDKKFLVSTGKTRGTYYALYEGEEHEQPSLFDMTQELGGIKEGGIKEGGIKEGGIKEGGIKDINENQRKILKLLSSDNKISVLGLTAELKINKSAVQKHLKTLKLMKLLERKGSKRDGYWIVKNDY